MEPFKEKRRVECPLAYVTASPQTKTLSRPGATDLVFVQHISIALYDAKI